MANITILVILPSLALTIKLCAFWAGIMHETGYVYSIWSI